MELVDDPAIWKEKMQFQEVHHLLKEFHSFPSARLEYQWVFKIVQAPIHCFPPKEPPKTCPRYTMSFQS